MQEEKIGYRKNVHGRICVRDIIYLAGRPPFHVIFCRFFLSTPILRKKKYFAPGNGGGWRPLLPSVSIPVSAGL